MEVLIEKNKDKQEMKSTEITNLKHIYVDNTGDGFYSWSTTEYDTEKKQCERILPEIKRYLDSKLNTQHKDDIQYKITSKLDGANNKLSLCLNMQYFSETDHDIDALISESKSTAKKILNSIKIISETKNIDLNSLKIQTHDSNSTTIKNGVALVPIGLPNALHKILEGLNSNAEIICSIDKENINLKLQKTKSDIFESDETEYIIGRISGVVEKDRIVWIKPENAKHEGFSYPKSLEETLIRAQLGKKLMKLKLKRKYIINRGYKKVIGGTIIECSENKENQQLDLLRSSTDNKTP